MLSLQNTHVPIPKVLNYSKHDIRFSYCNIIVLFYIFNELRQDV